MTILKIAFAWLLCGATVSIPYAVYGYAQPEVTVYLVWLQVFMASWYFAEVTKPVPKVRASAQFVCPDEPGQSTFWIAPPEGAEPTADYSNITGYTGYAAIPITEKQE